MKRKNLNLNCGTVYAPAFGHTTLCATKAPETETRWVVRPTTKHEAVNGRDDLQCLIINPTNAANAMIAGSGTFHLISTAKLSQSDWERGHIVYRAARQNDQCACNRPSCCGGHSTDECLQLQVLRPPALQRLRQRLRPQAVPVASARVPPHNLLWQSICGHPPDLAACGQRGRSVRQSPRFQAIRNIRRSEEETASSFQPRCLARSLTFSRACEWSLRITYFSPKPRRRAATTSNLECPLVSSLRPKIIGGRDARALAPITLQRL
jgi:hypothetical protein